MSAPEQDDYVNDPANGWLMVHPQLSGGAPAPDFYRRTVAAESTAYGVSDGEPKQAGATDARMMRAAITSDPWLLLAGEFHASADVEVEGA